MEVKSYFVICWQIEQHDSVNDEIVRWLIFYIFIELNPTPFKRIDTGSLKERQLETQNANFGFFFLFLWLLYFIDENDVMLHWNCCTYSTVTILLIKNDFGVKLES